MDVFHFRAASLQDHYLPLQRFETHFSCQNDARLRVENHIASILPGRKSFRKRRRTGTCKTFPFHSYINPEARQRNGNCTFLIHSNTGCSSVVYVQLDHVKRQGNELRLNNALA